MEKKRKANQIQRVHGMVVDCSTRTWYGCFDKKENRPFKDGLFVKWYLR